jgi:hypothetical protein
MKTISYLYIIGLSVVVTSCGLFRSSNVSNNYATTTEQIFNLEQGMTLPEVSTTLKSEPKDVYSNIETKTMNQTIRNVQNTMEQTLKKWTNKQ